MKAKKHYNDKFSGVFTTSDITKLGIKRERIKDWLERGFIEPSIQRADGQGTKNYFSIFDLYVIMLFRTLIEHGFSRFDAGLRIKWFVMHIRGEEADYWLNTPFLGFVRIADEQDPIIKRFFHSGIKSAEAFAETVNNLPEKEYTMMLGSFRPLPIRDEKEGTSESLPSKCNPKWIYILRDIGDECDDITIINLKKVREQVDKLI